jgi:hypothetical protein
MKKKVEGCRLEFELVRMLLSTCCLMAKRATAHASTPGCKEEEYFFSLKITGQFPLLFSNRS